MHSPSYQLLHLTSIPTVTFKFKACCQPYISGWFKIYCWIIQVDWLCEIWDFKESSEYEHTAFFDGSPCCLVGNWSICICQAYPSCRAVKIVGLRPLVWWDCRLKSHQGHGCLSHVNVLCCRVEVSASGCSLIQGRPLPTGAVVPPKKKLVSARLHGLTSQETVC